MVFFFRSRDCDITQIPNSEMEMKKLHMGTVAYAHDSMDEVAHQLALAFGGSTDQGRQCSICQASVLFTSLSLGHGRHGSTMTGVQLASRGRRDMSSRVHDVVLSLALCHNVRLPTYGPLWFVLRLVSGYTRIK